MRQLKYFFIALVLTLFVSKSIQAQSDNYAMIDMEYITNSIPAFKSATEQIKKDADVWAKEIQSLQSQAKELYVAYQSAYAKLSDQDRVKQEVAIATVEKEIAKKQKEYFGAGGELAKRQEKLIKPIHDKIYEAVKLISKKRGYFLVLDRASGNSIVFADPSIDISNDVLLVLGVSK